MRKSLLFIPGNSPAMLQNADIFDADGVIFDLEDAVLLTEKDNARNLVSSFLKQYDFSNLEIIVRINPLDTEECVKDLDKLPLDKIDTIMAPKANTTELAKLDTSLNKIEKKQKVGKSVGIIPIIESADAVLDMEGIARCKRVNGLLLGAEDLASDFEVPRTERGGEIFYTRGKMAVVCKALKIDCIDTPYTNTLNEEGLKEDALFSKGLGFNAKACIHPNQVPIVNTVYAPSIEEINWAKRVLKALEKAVEEGKGAFSLDGKMIDEPIIKRARKILEKTS